MLNLEGDFWSKKISYPSRTGGSHPVPAHQGGEGKGKGLVRNAGSESGAPDVESGTPRESSQERRKLEGLNSERVKIAYSPNFGFWEVPNFGFLDLPAFWIYLFVDLWGFRNFGFSNF